MDKLFEVLLTDGYVWGVFGAAFAFFLAAIGSSKGVGIAGQAAAGVVSEDPNKFVSVMILEALPSTQGIYGFVMAFLILGAMNDASSLTAVEGFRLFFAGMPIAFAGLFSGIWQGKVAAASIGIVAKQPGEMTKGIVLTAMVELFAIFGLLVSILLLP